MATVQHDNVPVSSTSDVSVASLHAVGAVSAASMDAQAINIHDTEQTQGVYTDETGTVVSDVSTGHEVAIFDDQVKFDGDTALQKAHVTKLNAIESGADVTSTHNAATATKLATARSIGGTSFDGTADIEVVRFFGTNITKASTDNLTAAQCYCTTIDNYGQSGASTLTLPQAVLGLSFTLNVCTIGNVINIKPYSGDVIYLDGTALAADHKVSLATPVAMDTATFWTVRTPTNGIAWYCNTIKGVFSDGGA